MEVEVDSVGMGFAREGRGRERPGALLARGTPTMNLWSIEARSKGQTGHSLLREIEKDEGKDSHVGPVLSERAPSEGKGGAARPSFLLAEPPR
jgi:hypothetical protein